MAEELLINVNIEGEKELDKVTSKVEKLGKTGNKTQTELQKLRNELKEQKNAMLQAEEGSEEYGRALQRAAQIQQRMTDISKQIRAGMMGVGEVMANVSRTASGMAGGFGALTGAAQLFGVENEAVINSIARLQSIMSVASGLAQFADSIDALQELMGALRASTAMSQGGIEGMTESTSSASKQFTELGSNMGRSAVEIQALNKGLKEQPLWVQNASEKLKELNKMQTEMVQVGEEWHEVAVKQVETQEKLTNGIQNTTKGVKGMTSAFAGIVKSLGPMIAITAAVAALSYGIEKLIEWINKVPKDVELRIAMNEDVYKEVQKAEERIQQIRHNIQVAGSKTEIDLIKKTLQEEGIATEEQLKGLNDSKALLNAGFWEEYLENVRLVSENEYLIRKDVELRLQKELAQMRVEELRKTQTYLQGFASIFGLGELPKAINEVKDLNKEIGTFQKTFYQGGQLKLNPVKFNLGGKTPTGSTKPVTSPVIEQLYPTLTQKQINDYVKDLAERTNRAIRQEFKLGEYTGDKGAGTRTMLSAAESLLNTDLEAEFKRIDQKRLDFITKQREGFEKQMELYTSYADSLASISDSIVGLYDARMTAIDNYYAAEARLIEQSSLNEEEKNRKLAELDQERYNKQKVLFEQQKNWQKAFVMLNLASGLMNVYTRATLPVPLGGTPSPFNWIQAGLETAALIGQSVASIAQINAQQLQAPSTSTSGGGMSSVTALSPTKTSLTTKEENLNMMQKSGQKDIQSVVKVTEINEVQNRVRVREENSSY